MPRRVLGRRAACRAVCRRAGRAAGAARQQQVHRRAGAALDVGVGRIVVDSFDEIARLAWASRARRRPEHPGRRRPPRSWFASRPGVEAHTHEFVRTGQEDTKFGFSLLGRGRRGGRPAASCAAGVELVGVHAHIGARSSTSFRAGGRGAGDVLRPARPARARGRRRARRALRQRRVGALQAEWAASTRAACRRPASTGHTDHGRARALIVATAGITLYTVGTVKHLPGIRTYVRVDGGMSDNPRPVLYGSGYEAFLPRAVTRPRPGRSGWWASTARAATSWCPRPTSPTTSRWATPGHAGHRRLRLRHGLQLQQGAPAGRRLRRRGDGRDGGAAGDPRRPGPARRLTPAGRRARRARRSVTGDPAPPRHRAARTVGGPAGLRQRRGRPGRDPPRPGPTTWPPAPASGSSWSASPWPTGRAPPRPRARRLFDTDAAALVADPTSTSWSS